MPQQSINALDRRSYSSQNDSISNAVVKSTEQNISVTDIISEGPIEGLVNGGQSVFLNNDPMLAEEETFYQNSEAKAVFTTNSDEVTITLNKEVLKVRQGAASRFLCVHAIKTIKCTASNFNEEAFFTYGTYTYGGLTEADLTRVSGDTWDDDWNVATTEVIGLTDMEEGATIVNLETNSGKVFNDVKLTALSGENNVHMHRTGSDLGIFEDDEANGVVEHTIAIDVFLKIENIVPETNKIILDRSDHGLNGSFSFSITSPVKAGQAAKIPSSGVRFNPGTREQEALTTLEGVGTSSVALTVNNAALEKFDANAGNYTTVTASGAQAAQIDEVKLIIQYPSGMYLQVDRSGSLYHAGVGYHIELKVTNGLDQDWQTVEPGPGVGSAEFDSTRSASDVHNNTNADTVVWKFTGRKKTKFSQEIRIPLEGLQPFTGFSIRISRITKHDPEDYTQERRFGEPRKDWYGGGIDQNLKATKGGAGEKFRNGETKHLTGVYTANLTQALGLIKEKLNFPYTAHAHTTFSSRTFQSNPTRAYECKGLKIKVPSNYVTREENDGINAKYTRVNEEDAVSTMTTPQLWNGKFRTINPSETDSPIKRIYTDNPAWVFYDICTNDRYGLGDFLLESDIDKFSLYKVAKYCDELVPDGKGGLEPRFRSNIYLTKSTDAYKILKDFATVFRGILYWSNSQFVTVMDEPKEPIFTFNRSNVIDGSFEYQSSGNKTRTNQVVVSWNNPEAEYKIEPLIIEDRENIIKTGTIKSEKAVAFGCTSEGQAIRYGRWKLWTSVNQTELVSFKTGINAAFLNPGDIINIQDEAEFRVPFSGRVSSYNSSTPSVTIDREVSSHFIGDFGGGSATYEYTFSVVLPKRTVVLNQESATLDVSGGDPAIFNRGDEVTYAKVGGSVVTLINTSDEDLTNRQIISAVDTSGDLVNLQYIEETIVEERVIEHDSITTSGGKDTIPISSAFTVAPTNGDIWAIKEVVIADNAATQVSYKEYKILDIAESNKTEYSIGAVEHYNTKFDSVDRELVLAEPDPLYYREDSSIDVPSPKNIRIIRTPIDNFGGGEELTLEWDHAPLSAISAEAQNAFTEYEHLSEYEVAHSFLDGDQGKLTRFTADRNQLTWNFTNVPDGMHRAEVVTISKGGRRSLPIYLETEITDVFEGTWPHGRMAGIIKGGYSTHLVEMTNSGADGIIKFTSDSYILAPYPVIRSAKANTTADSDTYSLDLTVMAGNSWAEHTD